MATWKKVLTTAPLSEDIAASPAATKVLTSGDSGAVPTWEAPAASTLVALSDTALTGGTAPTINEHLIFNGTAWVSAPSGTVFTFDVTGFTDDGELGHGDTDELIGVGDYKAIGDVEFTVSYDNGPATGGYIASSASVGWTSNKVTPSSYGTSTAVVTNAEAIEYPVEAEMGTSSSYAARQAYTATSFTDGTTSEDFGTTRYVDFSNNVYYGLHTANSSLTATNVTDDLTSAVTSITNDLGNHTVSDSKIWTAVDVTSSKYFVFACPSRCITGTNTLAFKDNSTGLAVDMETVDTMNITNANSFEEEYSVFVTSNHSLGPLTIKTER